MYNSIPKSREWLIVNCVVNAVGTTLLGFYIFRGEKYVMITYNSANQGLVWLCNQRHG